MVRIFDFTGLSFKKSSYEKCSPLVYSMMKGGKLTTLELKTFEKQGLCFKFVIQVSEMSNSTFYLI